MEYFEFECRSCNRWYPYEDQSAEAIFSGICDECLTKDKYVPPEL